MRPRHTGRNGYAMLQTLACGLAGLAVFVGSERIAEAVETEDRARKGRSISVEHEARNAGFGDFRASMHMTLRNRNGEESTREMTTRTIETEGDGDQYMLLVEQPEDLRGTVVMIRNHKHAADDLWLYLPALGTAKKLNANNNSGAFLGSEFRYVDMGMREVEKFTYHYLRDEVYADEDCFVIARYPIDPLSPYTKQVVWVDKAEYRPLRLEYYDRKDSLLKTTDFREYELYLGRYWRAHEMFMMNEQTGKSTLLKWSNFEFHVGVSPTEFDFSSLATLSAGLGSAH